MNHTYPYVCTIENKKVKVRIIKKVNGMYEVSSAGVRGTEEKFLVHENEVLPDMPAPTHKFVHSSMFGSYETPCTLIRAYKKQALIKFFDDFLEEPVSTMIAIEDLQDLESQ